MLLQCEDLTQNTNKFLEKAFVSMWEQGQGFPRFKKVGTIRSLVFPLWGTWMFYSILVDLGDAVADRLSLPDEIIEFSLLVAQSGVNKLVQPFSYQRQSDYH
jgi:hypothetical protein